MPNCIGRFHRSRNTGPWMEGRTRDSHYFESIGGAAANGRSATMPGARSTPPGCYPSSNWCWIFGDNTRSAWRFCPGKVCRTHAAEAYAMTTILKLGLTDHGRPMSLEDFMAGDYHAGN